MAKKIKSKKWFIKVRGSYLPNSWQGWLLYVPFMAFLIFVLVFAFKTQDTITETVFVIFPQWVAAAVVMTWIAARKS